MLEGVKALSFNKQEVGTMIKASKVNFRWRIELDGKASTIEVLSSKLSGKKRVYRDGALICDRQQFEGAFTYTFTVMAHQLTVMQHGEHFELRIDNVSFSHIHAQEQTKNQFVYENNNNQAASSAAVKEQHSFPFQTKSTGNNAQPTKFDFGGGSQSQAASSSQGWGDSKPGNSGSGGSGWGDTGISTKTNDANGWGDVASAKNEALGSSSQGGGAAAGGQSTSFDFNSYGQSQQNQAPTLRKAQPSYGAPTGTTSTYLSHNQKRAGIKLGGFQRQQQPNRGNKASYDTYGGDSFESGQTAAQKKPQNAAPGGGSQASGGQNFFDFNVESAPKEAVTGDLFGLDDKPAATNNASAAFDFGTTGGPQQTQQSQPNSTGGGGGQGFEFQFDTAGSGSQAQQPVDLLDIGGPSAPATPVNPLDILQGGSQPIAPAATSTPSVDINDLFSAPSQTSQPQGVSDTMAALSGLDLGGSPPAQVPAQLDFGFPVAASASPIEETKAVEPVDDSNLPISRKDKEVSSLVNFDDLGGSKTAAQKQSDEPSIYIKPQGSSGFSPSQPEQQPMQAQQQFGQAFDGMGAQTTSTTTAAQPETTSSPFSFGEPATSSSAQIAATSISFEQPATVASAAPQQPTNFEFKF